MACASSGAACCLALQPRRQWGEGGSYTRGSSGVFARLRSFAFNIPNANRLGSLARDRFRAAIACR